MLKRLTVLHVPNHNLIVFESLPPSVTPEDALLLGRAIQQAGIDALQGAKGVHTYPEEVM
ncbi:hypothetical protein [Pseudomonas sp. DSP3-2-2]|uniref:hypothetical protein n=1 Tax=unclassified Pseudomonas TaxID=196821 RepID=UPI003CE7B3AA